MSIQTNWSDPGAPTPDPGGDGVTQRGSDPNIALGGSGGLQSLYQNPGMSPADGQESSNSVSGLPSLPSRNQPSETPPDPPSLQDRSPGTIDQR